MSNVSVDPKGKRHSFLTFFVAIGGAMIVGALLDRSQWAWLGEGMQRVFVTFIIGTLWIAVIFGLSARIRK